MENSTIEEGKTTAIVSYLWFIGLIIAFVMNNDKKNPFASFHIRQMIGLSVLGIAASIITRLSYTIGGIISLALMVLWLIGFIGAIQGKESKIPVLGDMFQEWFKGIG